MPAKKLFISYSVEDAEFVGQLERRLDAQGFEVLRDLHTLRSGATTREFEAQIGGAHAFLPILSEHSVGRDWLEEEIGLTQRRETAEQIDLLCPLSIDDAWRSGGWRGQTGLRLRDQLVFDFSKPARFDETLERLVSGLRRFYGGEDDGEFEVDPNTPWPNPDSK